MFPMNDPSKVANADKVHFFPDLFNNVPNLIIQMKKDVLSPRLL